MRILAIFIAGIVIGCGDTAGEGRKTAAKIQKQIIEICGVTEGGGRDGPRTITPIDLDGSGGPTGFLVTCVNGKVDYVEATE